MESDGGIDLWNASRVGARRPTRPLAAQSWVLVQAYLDEQGWTLTDLSRASQIPVPTLSRWKNGRNDPETPTVQGVARATGISVNQLIGGAAAPRMRDLPPGPLTLPQRRLVRAYRDPRFRRIADVLMEELDLGNEDDGGGD